MTKICQKCGRELAHEDFLCPHCGAIWGDRVFSMPPAPQPPKQEEVKPEPSAQKPEAPKPAGRKLYPRILLLVVAVIGLVGLFLWIDWAGDGPTAPTTQTKLPEPTMTEPPTTQGEYVTYTVQLLDQLGYPVPNVRVNYPNSDPFVSTAYSFVISDADGIASFEIRRSEEAYFWISQIPEGYSMLISNPKYAFPEGQTHYQINLIHAGKIPGSYSVTMLDQQWLYAPLANAYPPGVTVQVYILQAVQDVGYMMFVSGTEIQPIPGDRPYLLYTFKMPEKDVTLDLKIISDRTHEDILRKFYTLHPEAEQVEVLQDYGRYGIADVVLLKTEPLDSAPFESVIGNLSFRYPNQNTIQVLISGQFLSLEAAFNQGYLTQPNLEDIYRLHMTFYPELYAYDVEYTSEPI